MDHSDTERIRDLEHMVKLLTERVNILEGRDGVSRIQQQQEREREREEDLFDHHSRQSKFLPPPPPPGSSVGSEQFGLNREASATFGSHTSHQISQREREVHPASNASTANNYGVIPGVRVRVLNDRDLVMKRCSSSTAGWRNSKESMLGKAGTVTEVESGVARVRFNGGQEAWFPSSVLIVTPALRSPPGDVDIAPVPSMPAVHPTSPLTARRPSGTMPPLNDSPERSRSISPSRRSSPVRSSRHALGIRSSIDSLRRNIPTTSTPAAASVTHAAYSSRIPPSASPSGSRRQSASIHQEGMHSSFSYSDNRGTDRTLDTIRHIERERERSPRRDPLSPRTPTMSSRTPRSIGAALAGLQKALKDLSQEGRSVSPIRRHE